MQRKDFSSVAPLRYPNDEGELTTDPRQKANVLSKHFQSVFTKEKPLDCDIFKNSQPAPTMNDIEFTENGVQNLLDKLNMNKAPGPNQIHHRIRKEMSRTIAPIPTLIYQKSYETGEIPDVCKTANVTPVFEKEKKSDPSSYRPISNLHCL